MKMISKSLIGLGMMAMGALGASAATPIDIRIGYGGLTMMDVCNMHDNWSGVKNAWGAVNAEVDFKATPNLAVGPSYTFSSTTTKKFGGQHSNINYNAVMLNGRYTYFKNSIFSCSAHFGLGVVVSHMMPAGGDSYNSTYFGIQASPVVAEASIARGLSMFGELGFGVQGLLQIGLIISL